jgi:hypothetical protein
MLNSAAAKWNATKADHTDSTGDLPLLWEDTGSEEGRVYRFGAYNPSTTAAITMEVLTA